MHADSARNRAGPVGRLVAAVALVLASVSVAPAVAQPAPAPAPTVSSRKVVGLVFDDSGSMKGRVQLPTFAAQLLASSLDPARDRLFTVRMSDYETATVRIPAIARILAAGGEVTPETMAKIRALKVYDLPREEFAQSADLKAVVKRIRDKWPNPDKNTPYGSVELMLQTLVAEAGPADEAHLVILTDGAFDPDPPLIKTVEDHLKTYNGRKRAPVLTVHFVLIDAQGRVHPNSPVKVADKVREQGVRAALTSVFNGRADDPLYEVINSRGLMAAMFDVIARINSTDRTARPTGVGIVDVTGRRLTLRSPLSVSRIVGVTFAPTDSKPAGYNTSSFGAAPPPSIESWMEGPDTAAGWSGETLAARAMQFNFRDALAPGSHWIEFDRPVGDLHLFLFDTLARFEVDVLDATGAPLPAGKDGVPEAVAGQSLVVAGTLRDHLDGRDTVVDPAAVANASATAWIADGPARTELVLTPDAAGQRYMAPLVAGRIGRYQAGGTFSALGFVRKEANRPVFRVVDGALGPGLGLALRPLDCSECRAGELRTRVNPAAPEHEFADIEARVPPERNPPFTLALEGAPSWVEIVDIEGRPIAPGQRLVAGPDGRLALRLKRRFDRPDEPRPHERHVGLRLRVLPPYTGEAATEATLHVEVPEVRLHYRGHTRPADADAPLRLSGADLHDGHDGLRFELEGLLGQPVRPEDVSVTTTARLVRLPVTVAGEWITARPVSGWCTCLVDIVGVPGEIEVLYRGLGETRARGPLEFRPTGPELLRSCGAIVLAAVLSGWLIGAVLTFVRAPRFPRGSFALIKRRNQPQEASEPLNRWDLSGNWRTVIGAIAWRLLPARVQVEGLHLEATQSAPRLLLASSNGDVKVINDGRTVRKIREEGRARDAIPVQWSATFSDPRSFERLSFRRH